jgi:glutathione peroxidase
MRYWIRLLACSLLGICHTSPAATAENTETVFDFSFETIDGAPYPLAQHQGKVLVVINTATDCGFASQFEGMQTLWERYQEKDVVVISVPSNDFNDQETRSNKDIAAHCAMRYHATFPIVGKSHVRDYATAHPLYRWVVDQYGEQHAPNWNFSKLVFDRNGALVDSFSSITGPSSSKLIRAIEKGRRAS